MRQLNAPWAGPWPQVEVTPPTLKPSKKLKTIVCVQQLVAPDLKLKPISAKNKLPNTCNKTQATKLNAEKLRDDDHEAILEEISRRTALEHGEFDGEDEKSEI